MATKKTTVSKPADHPPEGAWPGDPDYQAPAAPTREEVAVLDKGPEARAAAVAKDYKKMGVPR